MLLSTPKPMTGGLWQEEYGRPIVLLRGNSLVDELILILESVYLRGKSHD